MTERQAIVLAGAAHLALLVALSLGWAASRPPAMAEPEAIAIDLSKIAEVPQATNAPAAPVIAPKPEPAFTPPPPGPPMPALEPAPPPPAPRAEPEPAPPPKPAERGPKPEPRKPDPLVTDKASPTPAPGKTEAKEDPRERRRPDDAKLSSILGKALGPAKPAEKQARLSDILGGALGPAKPAAKPAKPAAAPDLPQGQPSPARAAPGPEVTASLAQAIASQIYKCWDVPTGTPGRMTVTLRLRLDASGAPIGLPQVTGGTGEAPAALRRAFDESARRAVLRCAPLRLPPEMYDLWKDIELNFDPRNIR